MSTPRGQTALTAGVLLMEEENHLSTQDLVMISQPKSPQAALTTGVLLTKEEKRMVIRHILACARLVSEGVPRSLVMMKSAPPVEVMPWATMNRAAAGQSVRCVWDEIGSAGGSDALDP